MKAALEMEEETSCEVCRGLTCIRYGYRDIRKPTPFCGACGRRLRVVMVDDSEPLRAPPRRAACAS